MSLTNLDELDIAVAETTLDRLAQVISGIAEEKGFWDYSDVGDEGIIPLKLALVHTEISEALEAHRKSYDDGNESPYTGMTPFQEQDFFEECADAVIRLLDIVGRFDSNRFGQILMNKIETNRNRPYRHGKRY